MYLLPHTRWPVHRDDANVVNHLVDDALPAGGGDGVEWTTITGWVAA
jgi:hypothetical protein